MHLVPLELNSEASELPSLSTVLQESVSIPDNVLLTPRADEDESSSSPDAGDKTICESEIIAVVDDPALLVKNSSIFASRGLFPWLEVRHHYFAPPM